MERNLAWAGSAAILYICSIVGYNVNDGHPSWAAFLVGLAAAVIFFKLVTRTQD